MAPRKSITDYFARRSVGGPDEHLRRIELGLVHHLLSQREFATLDSVLTFCRDPRNLSDFLPDPRDRRLFSRRLVSTLLEFRGSGDPGGDHKPQPSAARSHTAR